MIVLIARKSYELLGVGPLCSDWSRRALPGRLTLIAMKRPMETVIGAGLCDGCTGYSEHRVS